VKIKGGRRRYARRQRNFRRIPRASSATRKQEGNKGRRRTASTSSNASNGGRKRLNSHRRRNVSESSNVSEAASHAPLKKLREMILQKFDRKGLNMLNGYIKNKLSMAKFANNNAFLVRCRVMEVVPVCYRQECGKIRNTREVIRILDRFSVLLMEADLHYNKLRKRQVSQFLINKEQQLRELFDEEVFTQVVGVVKDAYETKFNRIKDAQRKNFDALLKEYGIVIRNKDEKTAENAEKTAITEDDVAKEKTEDTQADGDGPAKEKEDSKAGGDAPAKVKEDSKAGGDGLAKDEDEDSKSDKEDDDEGDSSEEADSSEEEEVEDVVDDSLTGKATTNRAANKAKIEP